MANEMYKVKLSDGTELKNLELNGNNFISKTEVTPEMFAGKLAHVTIEGPEGADGAVLLGEHEHMELIQIAHYSDGWYFVIRDIPADKLEKLKTRGDIEYLAMMMDVDL